jgi:hypothetical protein
MSKLILSIILLLMAAASALAQPKGDACHVYLIDSEAAQNAAEAYERATTDEQRARAVSGGVKVLGEFPAKVGEEELTTKTFAFPGSNLVITASVFYTDEMMRSATSSDSMLLGIAVADRAQENALIAPGNAVAEVTLNEGTDAVRVKTNVQVKGRSFLVGLQCNRKQPPARK